VDLVTSVIQLQTLQDSLSTGLGVQEDISLTSGLLYLLSAVNLCISLLHVLSVSSDIPTPHKSVSSLCQYKEYLRIFISWWFYFKIFFSLCLLSLVWVHMDRMESEQISIVSILASSTGFLCFAQKLSLDLSLLSECSENMTQKVPSYDYIPIQTEDIQESEPV